MSMVQVNLMHILLVGPLLLYIGQNKQNTNKIAYYYLGAISLMIPFVIRFPSIKLSYTNIVHLLHLILFLPVFWWISYKQDNISSNIYDLLIVLGISAIAAHSYYYYKNTIHKHSEHE